MLGWNYYLILPQALVLLLVCAFGTLAPSFSTRKLLGIATVGCLVAFTVTLLFMWSTAPFYNPKYNPPEPLFSATSLGGLGGMLIATVLAFLTVLGAVLGLRRLKIPATPAFAASVIVSAIVVLLLPYFMFVAAASGCLLLGGVGCAL
jgi:hypothetical protein